MKEQIIQIVMEQAKQRPMSASEMGLLAAELKKEFEKAFNETAPCDSSLEPQEFFLTAELRKKAQKSIQAEAVICMECGEKFRSLSKHLKIAHQIDEKAYREKWGLAKGVSLVCSTVSNARKKKMSEMRLWERKKPKVTPEPKKDVAGGDKKKVKAETV